jgi:glycosyltransferase involved in cell wall biosynthesis
MSITLWIAGIALALAWLSRIVDAAFGMPHVADIARPEWDKPSVPGHEPRVGIIVPARNEEEHIRETLTRLLALEYSNYEVIAINDRSSDRTGQIMDEVASSQTVAPAPRRLSRERTPLSAGTTTDSRRRLSLVHVQELPPGWMGKTHSMWTAGEQATGDWLLFTDADVLFKSDTLRRAMAYAEAEKADHLVLLPRMIMKLPGEKMMMAFFQTLYISGHRLWKIADPKARDHIGVGAFNLVRRSTYNAIGTYKTLKMEVLDDMKLGKVIKNAGFAARVVFGEDLISLRWAIGAFGIVNNLTKNFFALLSFQWWRLLGSVIGIGFLNLGPFLGVGLAHGWLRLPYGIALASILALYFGMATRSPVRPYYFFLHPVATGLFMYILMRSMFHTLWNDGIVWRGTRYPLEDLRKGMV